MSSGNPADAVVREALDALVDWRRAKRRLRDEGGHGGRRAALECAAQRVARAGDELLALADAGTDPAARAVGARSS